VRILIILAAIIVLLLILRAFARQSTQDLKKLGRWLLLMVAGALFLFLLATGRLHWIFALAAAALPVIYRFLPLLRYVPLLRSWYRRYQARQPGASSAAPAQASTVQAAWLRMTLNHASGDMDGEILLGQFQGQRLRNLTLPQLLALLGECQHDQDSQALLIAYLDRHHAGWRDQAACEARYEGEQQAQSPAGSVKMTKQEAYEILGLNAGASEQDIIQAHRRLMQKLHPDHGGSTYLAARINLAKDVLLNKT